MNMPRYLLSSALMHASLFAFLAVAQIIRHPFGSAEPTLRAAGGGNGAVMGGGFPVEYWGQVVPAPAKIEIPDRMGPPIHKINPDDIWNTDPSKPSVETDPPKIPTDPVTKGPETQIEQNAITHVGISQQPITGNGGHSILTGDGGTGAGVGVGVGNGEGDGFDFGSYLMIVRHCIWSEWAQSDIYGSDGTCAIGLTILKDGSVSNIQLEKPSRNPSYDHIAMRAIRNASPFPPLPTGFPKSEQRFRIKFKLLD